MSHDSIRRKQLNHDLGELRQRLEGNMSARHRYYVLLFFLACFTVGALGSLALLGVI